MALDFFGVKLRVAIETFQSATAGTSQIIELWTNPSAGTKTDRGFKALSFVSQVNVTLLLGHTSKIQVVLTPPFDDGLALINSSLLQFGIGRLFVQFGYSTGSNAASGGHVTEVYSGLLQKPDVRIGKDISITLNALGVGYAMNITGGAKKGEPEFKGDSWASAVHKVLKNYAKGGSRGKAFDSNAEFPESGTAKSQGFINIDDLYSAFTLEEKGADFKSGTLPFFQAVPPVEGTEPVPKPPTPRKGKRKRKSKAPDAPPKVPGIQRGSRNDWWFVTEAVKKFGYDLLFEGTKVRITDQAKWLGKKLADERNKKKTKHFLLRGEVNPEAGMYPILSFSSPTTAVWMSPGVGAFTQADVATNKDKSKSEVVTADAKNVTTASGKKESQPNTELVYPSIGKNPIDAAKHLPGNPNEEAARATARGAWKKLRMDGGVTGMFTTLGIPDLLPGDVVQVSGFQHPQEKAEDTDPFNGPFGVMEVRHSVGVGGFQTQFRAVSNVWSNKVTADANAKVNVAKSEELPTNSQLGGRNNIRRSPDGIPERPRGLAGEEI